MLDSNFRSYFQTLFIDPLATLLSRLGFKPHHVTIAALIAGFMASGSFILGRPWLAVILLLCSGLLDATDGTLARKTESSSDTGCVLDIVGDRLVEAAMVLALFLYDPTTRGFPSLVLLASFYVCITTFLLSGIFERNQSAKSFHYSPGLIERGETFAFFVVVMLWEDSFTWGALLFATLVSITTLRRFVELMRLSSLASCPPTSQKNPAYPDQATMPTRDQQEKS